MTSIGPGEIENSIRTDRCAFRVVYLGARPEGIYVLHCFQKKAQKTAKRDLQLARKRFKALPEGLE
jgi:phage-related protein